MMIKLSMKTMQTVFGVLCLLFVLRASPVDAEKKDQRTLAMWERRPASVCREFCQEIAAVTLYSGPPGTTSLNETDHEILFSAYVVNRRIALTAGSAWEKVENTYNLERIRICHVHNAKPKNGKWRSCGKIRRSVYPRHYGGAKKAMDIVMIKIIAGNLGVIRRDPDRINFGSIDLTQRALVYGYGNVVKGEAPAKKTYWFGDSRQGFNDRCEFDDEVDKGRYICVIGDERLEFYKPGDEGGLFLYFDSDLQAWSIGGIITNYNGSYGDIPMVLRLDKPNVQTFIRRTVKNMQGELEEAEYIDYYGS